MSIRKVNSSARYHKLNNSDEDFVDSQFQSLPTTFPTKAVALAIFLFILGTILLVIGCMLLTGYIDVMYADRTWPVVTLGVLLFIPGFYHVRIAFYAWRGYKGFSYNDIPDFN
ncbi:transmembrane protein 230 isoform X1 [Hydra vulgaris]|uniref:Transmembrane protein 230 n=1 Tax=Hydra vulgaris TaxID=6087 RepID=T2M8D7_HYDVU|nr:transmembrane protein 230 [Hydra vulgaris]